MIKLGFVFPIRKKKQDLSHYFCSSKDYGCWAGDDDYDPDEEYDEWEDEYYES